MKRFRFGLKKPATIENRSAQNAEGPTSLAAEMLADFVLHHISHHLCHSGVRSSFLSADKRQQLGEQLAGDHGPGTE